MSSDRSYSKLKSLNKELQRFADDLHSAFDGHDTIPRWYGQELPTEFIKQYKIYRDSIEMGSR